MFYFLCTFLSHWSTSCQPVEQTTCMEKWSQPLLTYLCAYFSIFFFTFSVPSCALPLCPAVSSMTIVSLLLNQAKQKMYMVQIHILALSVMCPKIYLRVVFYFSPTGTSEKPLPQNAVVAEYCILSGGILMLLWATSAGWRRPRVWAVALRTE